MRSGLLAYNYEMTVALTSSQTPLHSRRSLLGAALATSAYAISKPAHAQMRIDVSGVGASQLPIAIASFVSDGRVPQEVVNIIRADLARSGNFRVIDPQISLNESAQPPFADLRAKGAETVLSGSVVRLADGRFDLRYRLADVARQTGLAGESLLMSEADLRYGAHRIADAVFEKLTGERGIFATRLAFVSVNAGRYRLNLSDWDGENIISALSSPEPIISPAWSPDGARLAYVSFENKKPVVYNHRLSSGQRAVLANFKGSNSAPSYSPDGKQVTLTLTREGRSQIYLLGADGSGNPQLITSSNAIDTEARFAPDGRNVYFTSDRGGSPQIYRVASTGGDAVRVTFNGPYNVSPRISPDGKSLVFVSRREGRFLVVLRDLAGNAERVMSETGTEESPSFAPNGKWILYATRSGNRDSLVAVSIDGRVRQRLSASAGDIREPVWGPFSS
jgi:TolB protein